jgi:hypothetical protein
MEMLNFMQLQQDLIDFLQTSCSFKGKKIHESKPTHRRILSKQIVSGLHVVSNGRLQPCEKQALTDLIQGRRYILEFN